MMRSFGVKRQNSKKTWLKTYRILMFKRIWHIWNETVHVIALLKNFEIRDISNNFTALCSSVNINTVKCSKPRAIWTSKYKYDNNKSIKWLKKTKCGSLYFRSNIILYNNIYYIIIYRSMKWLSITIAFVFFNIATVRTLFSV